ncbi:hypothetical protein VTN02DRAFT_1504 [Thermoascus thermophilus]
MPNPVPEESSESSVRAAWGFISNLSHPLFAGAAFPACWPQRHWGLLYKLCSVVMSPGPADESIARQFSRSHASRPVHARWPSFPLASGGRKAPGDVVSLLFCFMLQHLSGLRFCSIVDELAIFFAGPAFSLRGPTGSTRLAVFLNSSLFEWVPISALGNEAPPLSLSPLSNSSTFRRGPVRPVRPVHTPS